MIEFGDVKNSEKGVSIFPRTKERITILTLTGTLSERGRQQTTGGKYYQGGSYGRDF